MTRARIDYTLGATSTRHLVPEDENPALGPIAGLYRIRRGVWRPVAVMFGAPLDPVTDEPLDRSPRWQILYCGRLIWDHTLVWPACWANPIDRDEYVYLIERMEFAKAHDPRDPFGSMSSRIDLLNCSVPVF
jgi:hypothetical protein